MSLRPTANGAVRRHLVRPRRWVRARRLRRAPDAVLVHSAVRRQVHLVRLRRRVRARRLVRRAPDAVLDRPARVEQVG